MTIYERARAGEPIDMRSDEYQAVAVPELKRSRTLCHRINMLDPYDLKVRELFDELFEGRLPATSNILTPVNIDRGATISIGENVFINWNFSTVSTGSVTIEDNVQIACNVQMLTANHDYEDMMVLHCEPIVIKKDAWIGAGSTIMGGVIVGEGAVVAAGSVVTKDVEPFTIVGGNPARVLKKNRTRSRVMRNVLLLGASGTLGKAVTEKLLSETDLKLTLFARHATDVYTEGKATVIDGDATESDTLKDAMVNQDVIVCMVSGEQLPEAAKNIVACMDSLGKRRLIFMGAVGIYNEIPDVMDGEDNVDNNPDQVPNRKAVDIIEASNLEYTVLRPGYQREGKESDYVLSFKGEAANGYITSIPSLVNLIHHLIEDDNLYRRESVSITKDMRCFEEIKA